MKRIVCAVALVTLLSACFAGGVVGTTYYGDYYGNSACLGEPDYKMAWTELEPPGSNCSSITGGWGTTWMGAPTVCPTTPGSEWYLTTYDTSFCNHTAYADHYVTEQCTSYNDAKKRSGDNKRGAYDGSYFLSCSSALPVNPYIQVKEVGSCEAAPVPPPVTVTRGAKAAPGDFSHAIFANTPGSCTPYFNDTDFSDYLVYATYVKIPVACDPASTTTFDVTFYNDSTCTHLKYSGSFELGCHTIPGFVNPMNITCVGPAVVPTGTTPTATPTNAASPLSLSLVLLAFLVIALTVLIM